MNSLLLLLINASDQVFKKVPNQREGKAMQAAAKNSEQHHILSLGLGLVLHASCWFQRKIATICQVVLTFYSAGDKMACGLAGKLKELGNTVLGKFGMSLDNFKAEKDPQTGSYSINFKQ